MSNVQTIDVKNLSSRKLWALVSAGDLPQDQQHLAEQELLLRRRYLEYSGSLRPAGNDQGPSLGCR